MHAERIFGPIPQWWTGSIKASTANPKKSRSCRIQEMGVGGGKKINLVDGTVGPRVLWAPTFLKSLNRRNNDSKRKCGHASPAKTATAILIFDEPSAAVKCVGECYPA